MANMEEKESEFKSKMTEVIWNFWQKAEYQSSCCGKKIWGYPTGYRDYDELTGGLQKSELTVIAARHSMGKSSFVLNLADFLAENNIPVLFISYDMSGETISSRLISSKSGISSTQIKNGNLRTQADHEKIIKALILQRENLFMIKRKI